MTDEEIPTDAPLYRCVWKKSKSVTKYLAIQLGTAIAYAILITIALALAAAAIMWVLIPVGIVAVAVGGIVYGWLTSIPLYIYIILAIILSIVGYSTVWCLTRDYTEMDWHHGQFISTWSDLVVICCTFGLALYLMIILGMWGATIPAHGGCTDISTCTTWVLPSGIAGMVVGGIVGMIFGFTIAAPVDAYFYHKRRLAGTLPPIRESL